MRGLVFLASGLFFNESLGLFGVRHCVNSAVPFFHMDLCRFRDQHCFFNESLGLFGLGPFFFNESLGLFGVRHFVRQCCAVFLVCFF